MKSKSFYLWLWALCPLTLVLSGIAYGFGREYWTWPQVRQQLVLSLEKQRQDMQAWQTTRAGLTAEQQQRQVQLNQLWQMGESLTIQIKNYDLTAWINTRDELHGPDVVVDDAPLAELVVTAAEPLINQLSELLDENLTNNDRASAAATIEVLQLCFRYWFNQGDADKAQQALTLWTKLLLNDSYDYDATTQRNLLERCESVYTLYRNSLAFDLWSQSQLTELSDLILVPLDISARLAASRQRQADRAAMQIAQAYNIDGTPSTDSPLVLQRTSAVDSVYLENLLAAASRSDGIHDASDLAKSIAFIDRALTANPLVQRAGILSVDFPFNSRSVSAYWVLTEHAKFAFQLAVAEDSRRLTLLAVQIKQYELQQGHWPKQLEHLDTAGFDSQSKTGVDGHPFHYSVTDDLAVVSDQSSSFWNDHVHDAAHERVLRQLNHWFGSPPPVIRLKPRPPKL